MSSSISCCTVLDFHNIPFLGLSDIYDCFQLRDTLSHLHNILAVSIVHTKRWRSILTCFGQICRTIWKHTDLPLEYTVLITAELIHRHHRIKAAVKSWSLLFGHSCWCDLRVNCSDWTSISVISSLLRMACTDTKRLGSFDIPEVFCFSGENLLQSCNHHHFMK